MPCSVLSKPAGRWKHFNRAVPERIFMKTKRILTAIALIAIATASAAFADGLTTEEQNFQRAFETFRAKYHLDVPMLDESLVDGSRAWSLRMRETGTWRHGSGPENIYRGSSSGIAAFRAWERSPGTGRCYCRRTSVRSEWERATEHQKISTPTRRIEKFQRCNFLMKLVESGRSCFHLVKFCPQIVQKKWIQ